MGDERPVFKYTVEHALLADCTFLAITSAHRLAAVADEVPEVDRFHLYMIARRPRVTVDRSSWVATDETLTLAFEADWGDGEPARAVFTWPNLYDCIPVLMSEPPYNVLQIGSPSGELLTEATASLFVSALLASASWTERAELDGNFLDLSVEYVGRAIGTAGHPRSAVDRLRQHETLQRILADSLAESPHLEVWLVLLAFEDYTTIGVMGQWDARVAWSEEEKHLAAVHGSKFEPDQVAAVAEGALIRYFQPAYNVLLKKRFPNPRHTSYREPYVRDLGALGFQMETTPIGARLRSAVIEPSFVHGTVFRMSSDEDRRAFVDYWDDTDAPPGLLLTTLLLSGPGRS